MNILNADSLIQAGRMVAAPFRLTINDENGVSASLTVEKILRLLPGKRLVAVAVRDQQTFLVKIFIGRSVRRYKQREVSGVEAIEKAGVLTPRLQWQAELESGNGYVLAFEYLEQARDLIDVWREAQTDPEKLDLIGRVMPSLAALHAGGVIQNDIHPENFLFVHGQIYTIDGGDITQRGVAGLNERESLDNLALFLAQFQSDIDPLVSELLSLYQQKRSWQKDPAQLGRLRQSITMRRRQRKADYIEKAFRECTRFVCRHSFRRFTVCERSHDSAAMQTLLADPDSAIAAGELLKDGNTATVALVDGPAGKLVIKRYNIKGVAHHLSRAFRKSRAWISWANTIRLEFFGIRTLAPVALIEERWGPLRGRAYFVTEYIDGPDASSLTDAHEPWEEAEAITKLLEQLANAGVSHGDLKATNFLMGEQGPVLIDLDSMKEHASAAGLAAAMDKDKARFLRNWEASPRLEERFENLLG